MKKQTKPKRFIKPRKPKSIDFVHHPHDNYLRYMLAHKVVAQEVLQFKLPPHIYAALDWDTLTLEKDGFTDRRLKSMYADTIYRVKIIGTGKEVVIRFIKEYKSTYLDQPVTPQLLKYTAASLDLDVRQNLPLSLPVSILIYHGEVPWEKEHLSDHFQDVPAFFQEFIPDFEYILLNTHDLSAEEILNLNLLYLPNILMTLKFGRNAEKIKEYLHKMLIFAKKNIPKQRAKDFFNTTFIYLNAINTKNDINMANLIQSLPPTENLAGKSILQELLDEGMEKGIEKGMEKGMEKGIEKMLLAIIINNPELNDMQIAQLYNVDVKLVNRLRKERFN
jgi:predicted transposase YdaD